MDPLSLEASLQLIEFHYFVHQEVFCSKATSALLENVMRMATKMVNFIITRDLSNLEYKLPLKEGESQNLGLLMNNNVGWLNKGCWSFCRLFGRNDIVLISKGTTLPMGSKFTMV